MSDNRQTCLPVSQSNATRLFFGGVSTAKRRRRENMGTDGATSSTTVKIRSPSLEIAVCGAPAKNRSASVSVTRGMVTSRKPPPSNPPPGGDTSCDQSERPVASS